MRIPPPQDQWLDLNDLLTALLAKNRIDTLFNTDEAITCLSTGYTDLDGMTSGFSLRT